MKSRIVGAAAAAAFVLAQLAAPAYAEPAFRTAEPQSFTTQDLQEYGLSAEASDRAVALQQQGYQIRVLTPEEAQQYQAGITDNQWIWLGILAGVIIIAVAVAD